MSKGRISFDDALAMVPDDLPDGAFFAMAHEIAGLEYGDGFPSVARRPGPPAARIGKALRKKIEAIGTLQQNDQYHWQVRADGKVLADWWPHKNKFRIGGRTMHGTSNEFVKTLARHAGATQQPRRKP